jgi:hypothetical protein
MIEKNQKGMEHLEELEEHLKHPYGDNLQAKLMAISKADFVDAVLVIKARKEWSLSQSQCKFIGEFARDKESETCYTSFPGLAINLAASGLIVIFLGIMIVLTVLMRRHDGSQSDESKPLLILNN